jgi:hypothetical protein
MVNEDFENNLKKYNELFNLDYSDLEFNEFLPNIARLSDLSNDLRKIEGIDKVIKENEIFLEKKLEDYQSMYIYYILGSTYETLKRLTIINDLKNEKDSTSWDFKEYNEKEIIYLRKALLIHDNLNHPDEELKNRALTNLGNLMCDLGRYVESLDYYERLLKENNSFGMALGAKGMTLYYYASILYDNGHQFLFLKESYQYLKDSLTNESTEKHAKPVFEKYKKDIESEIPSEKLNKNLKYLNIKKYFGGSKKEIKYRKWCLENCLFINPLNDLFKKPIACSDVLSLPNMRFKEINGIEYSKPYFWGIYNQLKQEFITARYLYYEGTTFEKNHFSDKERNLLDTMDYSMYSMNIEKIKIAYKNVYSILDKIAYFLYLYFAEEFAELNVNSKTIYFKTVWYNKNNHRKFKEFIRKTDTKALLGLYWLSRDIYANNLRNNDEYIECLEPDAQNLDDLRNFLEHKHTRIHMFDYDPKSDKLFNEPENIAKDISLKEFTLKTLKMLKLVRNALIYLSCAVCIEESKKMPSNVDLEIPFYMGKIED